MTDIPDFSNFRIEAERMLGRIVEALTMELCGNGKKIYPKDVIKTDNGLFSIIEENGKLFVANILLYITEIDVSIIEGKMRPYGIGYLSKENIMRLSEQQVFFGELHKYHFMYCKTIQEMVAHNRGYKYRQTQRVDGNFVYRFIKDNEEYLELNGQRLRPCKKCWKEAAERYKYNAGIVGADRDDFSPDKYFNFVDCTDLIRDDGFEPVASSRGLNLYTDDWPIISREVKRRRNYTCENCNIELKEREMRKYLHCHHIHGDKTDNRLHQLMCLCIKCHAEQPYHSQLKRHRHYDRFLQIWFHNRP